MNEQHLKWIQEALDADDQGLTLEDVKTSLEKGESQFWPAENGCAITEVTQDLELNVWLYGGDISEIPKLDASCVAWCKEMGIARIVMWGGRKGWNRYLKKFGYVEKTIMVKEIGNVE